MTSKVYIAQCEHRALHDSGLCWGLATIMGAVDAEALSHTLPDDQDSTHSACLQRRSPSRGHTLPSRPLPDSL